MSGSVYPCKYLKLPFSFDVQRIEAELQALNAPQWVAHFNTHCYEGNWHCLPLRSANGADNDLTTADDANYQDTPALGQCPYLQQVLDSFECEKNSIRLMTLAPGSSIKSHRDRGGAFEDGIARLHIPLRTHPDVTFVVEEHTLHMSLGDTWYLNAACTHAVYNRSPQSRIHLLLDCRVNPWLERLFTRSGFIARALSPYGDPLINDNNVQVIIRHLRSGATPADLILAQQLETTYRGRGTTS